MNKNYLKVMGRVLICLLSIAVMVFLLYNAIFLQWWAIVTLLIMVGIVFFFALVEVFYNIEEENGTNT